MLSCVELFPWGRGGSQVCLLITVSANLILMICRTPITYPGATGRDLTALALEEHAIQLGRQWTHEQPENKAR